MEDFESWARAEIVTAQAKVRETERALELFLTWRSGNSGFAGQATPGPVRNRQTSTNGHAPGARKRASKNDAIFLAFEKAGPDGLSQEDVQRVARELGLNTNPNALRALCWSAKQDGRLISLAPGRYAIAQRDETAPRLFDIEDGDAVSARADHNQHREGDAGGGT